jgi:hypothetical protein
MAITLNIQEVLGTARGKLRGHAFRRQSLRLITWFIGLVGTVAVLDHLYRFTDWQRWLVGGGLLATLGVVHWFGRDSRRQGRKLSDIFVARELEKANPALHNTLVTALQANRPISLSEQMQDELDTALATIGQTRKPSVYRWAFPATILLLLVYSFTAPQSVRQSMSRVLMPWRDLAPPTYTVIVSTTPDDGDYLVTENPWRVTITAAGYAPETGELHARRDGGPWQKMPLAKSPDADQYSATLPPVSGTWTLRARLGDAYVKQRHVKVLQRPATLGVRQQLVYPEYLDQSDAELKQWPVQAVVGTRVDLEIQLDRNVDAAKLDWCGTSIALRPVGRLLRTNSPIPIEYSGNWRVYYRLAEAEDWIRGDGAKVTAVPDLLPQARILQPEHDVEVNADSLVDFQYEATDDFILTSPEIIVRRFGSEDTREIQLPQPVLPDRLAGNWTFLPHEFDAKPGDRFTVAMRVRDGHPGHLPGWSDAIGITVTAPVAPIVADNEIELSEAQQPESQPATNPADQPEVPENKPKEPPTAEEIANAQPTEKPADPEAKPDAVVETDKIPDDPDGKQQPITKTDKEPTGDGGDKPPQDGQKPDEPQTADNNQPNGDPQDQQNPGDNQQPGDQAGDQQQQAANDQLQDQQAGDKPGEQPTQKPGEQPGDQQQQAADEQQPGDQPGQEQQPQEGQQQQAGNDDQSGQQPGQKTAGNQQPGEQPGDQGAPGEQPGNKEGQQVADNQQPGQKSGEQPAATNTPDGNSTGPGAELAGNEDGDGDPAGETSAAKDNAPLPDFTETEAPTVADAANPFAPNQRTDDKADLATNQAPIPSDAPKSDPLKPDAEQDEPLPDQLETFERMTLDADRRYDEAKRNPGAPAPKPGFAPAQYNADDVDLIQSFREAANRLLRQKKK